MVLGSFISTDKNAIVCEIGRAFTRCGYAGDYAPRCIVRTRVQQRRTGRQIDLFSLKVDSGGEFYEHLIDFLDFLYFKQLLANPRDRSVVLVESVYSPSWLRELLARAFFTHFAVPAILFVPAHLASLFAIGKSTGLIVDVGYLETHVTPVFEGVTLLDAAQWCSVGAKAIHERVGSMMLASSHLHSTKRSTAAAADRPVPLSSVTNKLEGELVEDVKVRFCFCTTLDRASQYRESDGDAEKLAKMDSDKKIAAVELPFNKSEFLLLDSRTREFACECLFEMDADETSVATTLLDTLIAAPIDTRRALAENIVLVGGTSMLRGFKQRLKAEMLYLLEHGRKYRLEDKRGVADALRNGSFRFAKLTAPPNYTAWLGAAIVANLDLVQLRSVTRETFAKTGRLSDWTEHHFTDNRDAGKSTAQRSNAPGTDGSPNKSLTSTDPNLTPSKTK